MENPEDSSKVEPPLFAIELLDFILIMFGFSFFLNKLVTKISTATYPIPFHFKPILEPDLSNSYFVVGYFGLKTIENTGQFKKYLNALSTTVPGATVVFGVSSFSQVDPSIYSYNLTIKFEKFGNGSYEQYYENDPQAYQYIYNGIRFKFYADFFIQHPEIHYAIFSDLDMLFLKNPFELLRSNRDVVHFMYDYKPFHRRSDNNYIWLSAWIALSNSIKTDCGITWLNKTADDPSIKPLIPWNVGLMLGKTTNLIPISELIYKGFLCPGMFLNNAEQGLLNHYVLTGQLSTLGIRFKGHYVPDGAFMSCPHSINVNVFRDRINSGNVYAIHHYQLLKPSYVQACYQQLREFIQY